MKTAITIHIAERVFTIDEDAHAKLDEYLSQLREYFAKDASEEESAEIIVDIENRIGEILEERLGENRPAVNMTDVEHIMKEMGAVEDIAKEDDTKESGKDVPETAQKSSEEEGNWKPGKKLYRDPDGKVIGGVSAGLAAYFDVDVTFFRIAFLLLLLVNGVGLLVYGILWIAMPEAETAAEKAAMRGKRANISNIEKNVKERLAQGLTEEDRAKARTGVQKFYGALRELFQGVGRVLLAVLKVLSVVLAIAFAIGGFLILAAGSAIFVQIWAGAPETVTVGPITHVLGATGDMSRWILGSAYVTIVFFGLFLMTGANSIFRKGKNAFGWVTTVLFILFFISAIVTANLGLRSWPEVEQAYGDYKEQITATEVYEELDEFHTIKVSGAVDVNVHYAETARVELIADSKVIDQYEVVVKNGVLQLDRSDWKDWCILWCYNRPTQLDVAVPTFRAVELSGASDAMIQEFPELDEITISASGASDIDSYMSARKIVLDFSGASFIDMNTGEGEELVVKASGSSTIESQSYVVEKAVLDFSGASGTTVHATEELIVDASGSSWIEYFANPKIKMNVSGASDVRPSHANYDVRTDVSEEIEEATSEIVDEGEELEETSNEIDSIDDSSISEDVAEESVE